MGEKKYTLRYLTIDKKFIQSHIFNNEKKYFSYGYFDWIDIKQVEVSDYNLLQMWRKVSKDSRNLKGNHSLQKIYLIAPYCYKRKLSDDIKDSYINEKYEILKLYIKEEDQQIISSVLNKLKEDKPTKLQDIQHIIDINILNNFFDYENKVWESVNDDQLLFTTLLHFNDRNFNFEEFMIDLELDDVKYIYYYTYDVADIILFFWCDDFVTGMNIISKINLTHQNYGQNIVTTNYSYSICSSHELKKDINIPFVELRLVIRDVTFYTDFLKELKKILKKNSRIQNYNVLGSNDVYILMKDVNLKELNSLFKEGKILDYNGEFYNKFLFSSEIKLLSKFIKRDIQKNKSLEYAYNQNFLFNEKINKLNSLEIKNDSELNVRRVFVELLNGLNSFYNSEIDDYIFLMLHKSIEFMYERILEDDEENYESLFQFLEAVNSIIHGTFHTDRQFIQTPSLNATMYDIPLKLGVFYTSLCNIIINLLKGNDNKNYIFLICPKLICSTEVYMCFKKELIGNRLLIAQIPEYQLFDIPFLMTLLGHEVGHFVGSNSRLRDRRLEYMYNSYVCVYRATIFKYIFTNEYPMMLLEDSKTDECSKNIYEKIEDSIDYALKENVFAPVEKEIDRYLKEKKDSNKLVLRKMVELLSISFKSKLINDIEEIINCFKARLFNDLLRSNLKNKWTTARLIDQIQFAKNQIEPLLIKSVLYGMADYYPDDSTDDDSNGELWSFKTFTDQLTDLYKESYADLIAYTIFQIDWKDYAKFIIFSEDISDNEEVLSNYSYVVRVYVIYDLTSKNEKLDSIYDENELFMKLIEQMIKFQDYLSERGGSSYNREEKNISAFHLGKNYEYLRDYLSECKEQFNNRWETIHKADLDKLRSLYNTMNNECNIYVGYEKLMEFINDYRESLYYEIRMT